VFAESAQVGSEHGLLPWRVEALFGLATIELLIDEESPGLLEMRRIALDAGLLGRAAQADLLLADHLLVRDGPAGSAEPASRVGEFGRLARIDFLSFTGEILLATRSALAGDERAMEFRLGPLGAVADLPPDSPTQIAGVRGLAAMVRHDLATASNLLDAAMRPMVEHRAAAPLSLFGAWALVATLVQPDAADVRGVLAEQTAGRRRVNQGALSYALAVVAGRAGDRAAAEAALSQGDTQLAATPWWRRFLRTYALEAAVIEGWADAVPRLRIDLAAFEAAGEEQLARLIRDLLRRAGAPTRRGRGDAVVPIGLRAVGVTSREMDVLHLIEQRQTNADIAATLFLSTRTVETHVSSLLQKSGATNRGELTDWASGVVGESSEA
jgi:DNA-binding CsgD family transcriptional regulator